ncbi:unnamed protein product [Orchesella dallaii]|uniref:Uncharacterized protein n=1 Tax=Orchesella dallaii TaxID=48710 RepID=A0ABP1PUM0_9HEXA
MQTLTISTQSDRPVTSNRRNKRSADESIPYFFYRIVWGRLPLLDGGNADKVKQDGMDLSSNLLTLPALFDRPVESHTRSKRIADSPWFHFYNRVIWPVIKGINTMG